MATARIGKDGDRIVLKMSFEEAAAVHALLARVGPDTHDDINEETLDVYAALDDVKAEVEAEDKRLWCDYSDFMVRPEPLLDPCEDNQKVIEGFRREPA